jgi:LmbE family N-acetylglucosaminyl deacetylase
MTVKERVRRLLHWTTHPAIRRAVRSLLFRVGIDVTEATAQRRCLVVAPHPDDETLGAAVTIMRKVDAGTPVRLLVVTDGSKYPPGDRSEIAAMRAAELHAASRLLGLPPDAVTQLPFVDHELAGQGNELTRAIAEVVREWRPFEVLVTSEADSHVDHTTVGAATRRAVAGSGARLLTYPIWQTRRPDRMLAMFVRWGRPELVRTDGYVERKEAAMAAYGSQRLLHRSFQHFQGAYEMFFPIGRSVWSRFRSRTGPSGGTAS